MKQVIQSILQKQAKAILAKQKPFVVAVTGSVGKTSTRQAIASVLQGTYSVRIPPFNYNNEFGVPLTIIGETSAGRSVIGWMRILWKGWRLSRSVDATYPRALVLEYGADRPGDIEALCDTAPPDVGVITAISPVHVENYPSFEALIEEKATLARRTKRDGLVLLSADDVHVRSMHAKAQAPVQTFGTGEDADIRASHVRVRVRQDDFFSPEEQPSEITYTASTTKGEVAVRLPNLLSAGSVHASLAALGVALHVGIPLSEAARRLTHLRAEPGRLSPLAGIKGSLILDDSYNAAPASMQLALETLTLFPRMDAARRIAVLGKMAELGPMTESEHRKLGFLAAKSDIDVLVAVGEVARDILRGAEAGGGKMHTEYFPTSVEAGRWLDREIKKGDIVLIKGSESARMEKAVKDVMAEPDRAKELLVRQYGKWMKE